MAFSFRARFLLAMVFILVLAILTPGIYLYRTISAEIKDQELLRARNQLSHTVWLLHSQQETLDSRRQLHDYVHAIGTSMDLRVTLVTPKGEVIADSEVTWARLPELDNHAFRPEIVQAQTEPFGFSIRSSPTLETNPRLFYVAEQVETLPVLGSGILRVAIPYSRVQARLDSILSNLGFFLLPIFAVLLLVGVSLVRQLEHSIGVMIDTAEAIGKGNYRKRIRVAPGKEFVPLADSINHMAEGIENQFRTIVQQKGQLEAILNGIREGVAVLDERGVIRDVNQYLERIFSGINTIQGLRPLELTRNPELQQQCDFVLSERRQGRFVPASLQLEFPGEQFYDVDIVPLQVRDVDLALIMVFHDITELKRLEKIRRDFVANVSHELRTPLTSIKGYAETVKTSEMDGGTRQSFLDIIIKNADNMNHLVRDLLQLAKLESAGMERHKEMVDPKSALSEAWKSCLGLADYRGIILDDQLPEEGIALRFHSEQLVQVFRNLLENAIKYSPPKEKITVFHAVDDQTLTIGVKDRGAGVPKGDQERIFERFYRVEKHRNKEMPGTGLGLAISRHIIRNGGGRIWVESPPRGESRGSIFFFSLPMNRQA
ncbi:MAG: HAMP domain-containing sensor histidine kinase [Desulfovibrionales bacterium]